MSIPVCPNGTIKIGEYNIGEMAKKLQGTNERLDALKTEVRILEDICKDLRSLMYTDVLARLSMLEAANEARQ